MPIQAWTARGAVAVKDGRIAASGQEVEGGASETLDFADAVLLPGFVDLHAHPAPANWKYGIDPDILMLPRGTTTILSQGDAGATNWEHYRRNVVEPASMRIRMALSAAVGGEEEEGAVFRNLEDVDVEACVRTIESDPELIWGIAVNAAMAATAGHDPRVVMDRVLEMAERTGKPLLYGVRWDPFDWPVDEQFALLRPGDVVTYCFHVGPGGLAPSGRVEDAAWEARERGVKFEHRPRHGIVQLRSGRDGRARGLPARLYLDGLLCPPRSLIAPSRHAPHYVEADGRRHDGDRCVRAGHPAPGADPGPGW